MGGVGTLPEGHMVTPPQRDWPVQVLLLTTVHKDGKFSTTHQPTSHWGLSLCPQEPPASLTLRALSAWLTRHSFKSTPCGCSLGLWQLEPRGRGLPCHGSCSSPLGTRGP